MLTVIQRQWAMPGAVLSSPTQIVNCSTGYGVPAGSAVCCTNRYRNSWCFMDTGFTLQQLWRVAKRLWCEDDVPSLDKERLPQAWSRLFNEQVPLNKLAEEDHGDHDLVLYPNRLMVCHSCEGAEIRQVRWVCEVCGHICEGANCPHAECDVLCAAPADPRTMKILPCVERWDFMYWLHRDEKLKESAERIAQGSGRYVLLIGNGWAEVQVPREHFDYKAAEQVMLDILEPERFDADILAEIQRMIKTNKNGATDSQADNLLRTAAVAVDKLRTLWSGRGVMLLLAAMLTGCTQPYPYYPPRHVEPPPKVESQYDRDVDAAKVLVRNVKAGDTFDGFMEEARRTGAVNALGLVAKSTLSNGVTVLTYDVGLEHRFVLTIGVDKRGTIVYASLS